MQSIIRKKSYDSVKVFFLNRKLLVEQIEQAAAELVTERPEVRKIILFGSVAEGRALPSSDIDLLLITDRNTERFIDRPSPYIPYFQHIPMSVDCFVYSVEEIQSGNHSIPVTAIKTGTVLFERG